MRHNATGDPAADGKEPVVSRYKREELEAKECT
jgi:hypothetical protein